MKGRPQEFMSVGIVHYSAFPEAIKEEGAAVETVRTLCEDDYFQAVEVAEIRDAAARTEAARLTRESGKIAVLCAQPALLAGGLDLSSLDAEARQAAVDAVRALLPQAKEWQARGLAVVSGPDPDEPLRADARTFLCASLKELCEFSRRVSGPAILLEALDRAPSGRNRLIGPSAEAAEIAGRVRPYYEKFGLMMDLGHLALLGETPDRALKAAPEDLRHVRLGNGALPDARRPGRGIPEAENDPAALAAFLKVLIEIGYVGEGKRNIVSLHLRPSAGQSAPQAISQGKETLDAAWKAL